MRTFTTLAAAAAIAVSGAAASAGGLAPVATPPEVMTPKMEPKGSVNSGYIVLGLLAALIAASGSF